MSCIFTLTDDLDAEFPAVAARRMGLSRVPLLCAREIPVPGALPRVIRVLIHCYPPRGRRTPARVPRRGARRCGWTSRARSRLRAHGARVREQGPPHPGLPGRRRLRAPRGRSRSSPPTSRPTRRCRRSSRRSPKALSGLNRYPDPTNSALRRRAGRPPRRAGEPDRDRQRLVRHPAGRRRGAARAGRRARVRVAVVLASTRTSRPRPARARSRSRSTPSTGTTSRRCGARSPSRRGS